MNIKRLSLSVAILALFMQSCEKMTYSEPTRMEDYIVAPEYTPDLTQNPSELNSWEKLNEDGEGTYFPYIYRITDKLNSMLYRKDYGIRFDAYDGGWGQRVHNNNFEVNGDFEIEFKGRIVQGTGDAVWQKGGVFIGELGDAPAKLWLSLENPAEPENGRICRFIPGAPTEWWWDIDHHNFSQFEWQVIKAVRIGNTLTIYRNGVQVATESGDYVTTLNGKVGLSTEALSFEYEYITVDGVKDDFTNMDNWTPLDKIPVLGPSEWTLKEESLNVVARYGWNHRRMSEIVVPENFTTEFEIKINDVNASYPKAGIMIGELGDAVPELLVGLDLEGGNNSVVKFINGQPWIKLKSPEGDIDVKSYHTIRVTKNADELFVYIDGNRAHYEKGAHVANIQGKLGIMAEGCEADFKSLSYTEN